MSKRQDDWDALDKTHWGYGNHKYREIDPSTINLEDYAQTFGGEEQFLGDVREYNSAYNEKYEGNTIQLDWLCRIGTRFRTNAPGYEGEWTTRNVPTVKDYVILVLVKNEEGVEKDIPAMALGVVVNKENMFEQVETKLMTKGAVDRIARAKLIDTVQGKLESGDTKAAIKGTGSP